MPKYTIETIHKAKDLWLQGFSFRKISEQLNVKEHLTVFNWSKQYNWNKEKPSYPINALKKQLERCTSFINQIEPQLDKINILSLNKDDKELFNNYNRLLNLQLRLTKQLCSMYPTENKSNKKSIFL